jgi:hypothetical protein
MSQKVTVEEVEDETNVSQAPKKKKKPKKKQKKVAPVSPVQAEPEPVVEPPSSPTPAKSPAPSWAPPIVPTTPTKKPAPTALTARASSVNASVVSLPPVEPVTAQSSHSYLQSEHLANPLSLVLIIRPCFPSLRRVRDSSPSFVAGNQEHVQLTLTRLSTHICSRTSARD